jgi:hypothetical protein
MAFTQLPTGGGVPNVDLITQTLAKLQPDAALQNYARMHKNDPYILSLATAEANRRKALRLAAQGQNAGQQPTVVDQNIAGMAPAPVMTGSGGTLQTGYGGPVTTGMAAGGLPEDQGIAQLPTPNMQYMADGGIAGYEDDQEGMATGGMGGMFNFAQQSEPVVRMAGGGVPGYKKGVALPADLDAFIDEQAKLNGIPPATLRAVIQAESSGNVGAQSKTSSAQGLMQIINDTFKRGGGDPSKRKDPFENVRVGAKVLGDDAAALRKQLNRDVSPEELYATHVLGRGTGSRLLQADPNMTMAQVLKAADPKNADNIISSNSKLFGNGKKTVGEVMQSFSTKMASAMPVGTAQAGEPPRPAAPDLASQIPGQRTPAPASTYDQQNSYFGRLADTMGIPQEYQRNIANTLNATSGFTSPISTANRAVGTASRALEATPEMIANAEKAKQIAETQRLLPPAKAGLEALDEASQATRAAAEAARRARGVEQDVKAAKAAEQSVDAANMTSKIARTTEEAVAAGPNARALDSAKLANTAKALSGTQLAEEKVKGFFAGDKRPEVGESVSGTYDTTVPPAEAAPKPSDIIAAAKEAVPAKDRKGFDGEDLLRLGLNLMANKSPNFITALGESGIQTLSAKKEREKAETDLEYKDIMKKYYGSLGEKAGAEAEYIASGEKGRMADRLKAATLIDRDLESWRKTMEGGMPQPGAEAAKRKELTNYYFSLFGMDVPATMAATAGVAIPQGVKVTRG